VKDTNFGHVAGIIANDDRLAYIGCQGQIEVAHPLEMNAIRAYLATFGHRQEQQIKLFETLGEPGEKAAAFPSRLRRLARFTMGGLMILIEDKALQLGFKCGDA
jgi:hypothetical protein